jgi:hypothetical protein
MEGHKSGYTARKGDEGKKYDDGKLRYDLMPPDELAKIVDILTFGCSKYGPNNWQNVENGKDRYYAALMRHLQAWRSGEIVDPESGRPHLSHVMCNAVFLSFLDSH